MTSKRHHKDDAIKKQYFIFRVYCFKNKTLIQIIVK